MKKQEAKFLVTIKSGATLFKNVTSIYETEVDEKDYSRKVIPLNRQAFRIALKRVSMESSSKKKGTRKLADDKKQQEILKANQKTEKKRTQAFKHLVKRFDIDTKRQTSKQLAETVAKLSPKVFKKFKQLVG